jgi:hypothetical protein
MESLAQRQADLNQKNVESEIQARADNAKTNRMNRDSLAEARKVQQLSRLGQTLPIGAPLTPGSEGYGLLKDLAPGTINPATPAIPAVQGTQPLAPDEAGPTLPSSPAVPAKGETFAGFPAQQEIARKADLQAKAQAKLMDPSFKLLDRAQKAAVYREATGSEPSEDIIEGRKEPHSQVYTEYQDYLSSNPSKPLSFNDYMNMDANRKAVRTPPDHGTFLDRPVIGADGKPDPSKIWVMLNGVPTIKEAPAGFSFGAKPGLKVVPPPTIDDEKAKKDLLSAMKNTGPNGKTVKAAATTAYVEKLTDPEVKKDIMAIRGTAAIKDMSADDLIKSGILTGTPDHIAKVKYVLDLVRGQQ